MHFILNGRWFLILMVLAGCTGSGEDHSQGNEEVSQAQLIVDRSIEAHGGEKYNTAKIEFDFRGRHYISTRDHGMFQYERIFPDTLEGNLVKVRDVLDNDGFRRFVDGVEIEVSQKMQKAYSNSVNSVLYFAQQPYFLNDPAVQKEYLGESVLKGQTYHQIRITFQQEGGGKDYEDVFVYWFHRDNYTMDYFAYSYITEGGGLRFRKAFNLRSVGGIRFADYVNYKADHKKYQVEDLGKLYDQGLLEELSLIENTGLTVDLLPGS